MLHHINYIFYTACKTNSCLCTNHHFNKICRCFLSLNKKKLLLKRKPVDPLSKSCVSCCFFTFCRGASSRLDKISKELEDEVRSSLWNTECVLAHIFTASHKNTLFKWHQWFLAEHLGRLAHQDWFSRGGTRNSNSRIKMTVGTGFVSGADWILTSHFL